MRWFGGMVAGGLVLLVRVEEAAATAVAAAELMQPAEQGEDKGGA